MSIAGKAAVSHDYKAKNGNLLKSTYANGWEVLYTYDNLDRVTEVKASKDGTSYTIGRYIYDKLGRVARFVDGQVSGKSCTYGYDLTDRLCEAVFDDGTAYRYDSWGRMLDITGSMAESLGKDNPYRYKATAMMKKPACIT